MKRTESTHTVEETHLSQSSLFSASTQFSDDQLSSPIHHSDFQQPQQQPPSAKAKYRFSSAFGLKGLRSKKLSKKSKLESIDPATTSTNVTLSSSTETGGNVSAPDVKPIKTDKRKFRFVKKLSLGHMNKSKKSSIVSGGESSSSATPGSLKRHTPEGANLSLSEISLVNISYDDDDDDRGDNDFVDKIDTTSATVTKLLPHDGKAIIVEKENKLHITTISDLKTQQHNDEAIEFHKPTESERVIDEPGKPERKSTKKLNITESSCDSWPITHAPAIPYNISEVEISKMMIATGGGTVGHFTKHPSAASSKGAIKKTITTTTQHKTRREYFEAPSSVMNKSHSLERGRRYPRPFEEIYTDPITITGNSLQNKNLSGSISDIPSAKVVAIDQQQPATLQCTVEDEAASTNPNIEFELGTKVRPPPSPPLSQSSSSALTSKTSSSNYSRSQPFDNPIETFPSHDSSLDMSSKSSESSEPRSEGSSLRRRIAYVEIKQNDLAETKDEPPLVEWQPPAARGEPLSHLSGISEYSLDSDFSMPAYGDLVIDEATRMSSITPEKREHLYKILVIGELGTGKTSFIKRYVHQFFSQNYRATIGVDFALKVLNWDQNTIIRLQLWDIAGQERFGNMTRVYYKEAVGAFIVFDVTRSATFDAVVKWKQDLDSKVQLPNGSPIPCILLANKCDQPKQGIVNTPQKMDEYVKENGFAGWFETSAKENVNIEEAARALVNKILLNDKLINSDDITDGDKFGLESGHSTKKNCSC